MALKFKISNEEFEALGDSTKEFYKQDDDGYRLEVEGTDDALEVREALRKAKEERAEAKRKLQEFETEAEKRERERLESQQEWEQLSKADRERAEKLEKELNEMRTSIAQEKRTASAAEITASLTRDTAREKLLRKEAMQFIHHTPEGIKINGPDGEAWDSKQLAEHLRKEYPFLVDGNGSSGGGAPGGKHGGGAATKKLTDMTSAERLQFKADDPEGFRKALNEL